jgi:hypothetical protein
VAATALATTTERLAKMPRGTRGCLAKRASTTRKAPNTTIPAARKVTVTGDDHECWSVVTIP